MKFIIFSVLFALLLQVDSRSYPFYLKLSDVFDLHWAYNATEDKLDFKVVATTNGWAALALTLTKGSEDMINYDIALGAVWPGNSSLTFIRDYWSVRKEKPTYDSQQDFTLLRAKKNDGKIEMEFSRKADTGDTEHDIKITNDSVVYLAWARADQNPTNVNDFMQHPDKSKNGRGHTKIGYNMLTGEIVEDVTPTTSPHNTAPPHLVSSLPLIALILCSCLF